MALGTFIAGRYSSTLNSVDLGLMEEGYDLEVNPKEMVLNRSDAFGDMLMDTIWRGADWFLQCDGLEYKAGPINAAFPYGAFGAQGVIGRLGSAIATSLVLTSTPSTPAAAAPATLTATQSKLAPGFNPRFKFSSELRKVPIRFVFIPTDVGAGVIKHFTQT